MQYIDNLYLSRLLDKSGNFMWSGKWPPCKFQSLNFEEEVISLRKNFWLSLYHQQTMIISFSGDRRHFSLFKRFDDRHSLIVSHCDSCLLIHEKPLIIMVGNLFC